MVEELPTCQCVAAQPPYDRLTSIYCVLSNISTQIAGQTPANQNVAQRANIMFRAVGDSLTLGFTATTSYPAQMLVLNPTWDVINLGVSSETVAQMQTRYPTEVAPFYDPRRQMSVVSLWGGTNDIFFGASAATVKSRIQTYCETAKAAGFVVVVLSIIARSTFNAGQEAIRLEVNQWLRENHTTFAHALSDVGGLSVFNSLAATANPTWYTDGTHITDAGQTLVAQTTNTAFATIPQVNTNVFETVAFNCGLVNNQSVDTATATKVLFDSEEFDTAGMFASSRFTPTIPGLYRLNSTIRWFSLPACTCWIRIYKNGALYREVLNQQTVTSNFTQQINAIVAADGVDDYFEIYAEQNSGGSVLIQGVNYMTFFEGNGPL